MRAITEQAILAFLDIERRKTQTFRLERRLLQIVAQIPDEDMTEYLQRTEKITLDEERKRTKK